MSSTIFSCQGLSKRFGKVQALEEVELELVAGSLVGLVGPSGSGKTTLLRIAGLLERPDKGQRVYHGQPLPENGQARLELRRRMAMVRQKPVGFGTSVANNIALGLKYRGLPPGAGSAHCSGLETGADGR